jgi:glycosyltransferase involved in cell wall biosynthesis
VLFAGRLTVEKGIDLLLDVWADPARAPDAPLRIAGDGPLRSRVEAVAAHNPDVHDLGRLDRAPMARALRESAVVAVPSRAPEALPTIVIEAFSHARPVVATPVGAIPEMVDRSVGGIAEPDPVAFAAALRATLVDAEARGRAARECYLDRYTVERSVDGLLSVYDEVVG